MTDGLFIGGPLDGQKRAFRHGNRVVVPIAPSFQLGVDASPADDTVVVTRFEYSAVEWHNHDEKAGETTVLYFWAPSTEPNPRLFVMQKLVEAYAERSKS